MSESENLPTPPPPSTPKTSAVPLKKETVRITLRSRPGEGAVQPREATAPVNPVTSSVPTVATSNVLPAPSAPKRATAPIQLPSAPLPPPAPKAATSPVKLPPPVAAAAPPPPAPMASAPPPPRPAAPGAPPPPAATVPMAAPAMPSPPSAPRPPVAVPVAPGAAPKVETGAATAPLAKTVPLKPAPAAPRAPGAGTAPMAAVPGGAPAAALPKATVKLQQTQPMARPSISAPPSAPVKRTAGQDSEQFYNEEKDPEEGLVPLSVVCLLLSAVLLVVQMFGSDRVSSGDASPIMVPQVNPAKWEMLNPDHTWSNNFSRSLPAIPQ